MQVPPFARLPLHFDAASLLAEVESIAADRWVPHFNAGYHDGGWRGAALRSVGGDPARLHPDASHASGLQDTPLAAACPRITAALERFECPLREVRILRLAPGSVIREHRDHDLIFEKGEARLHVPLATHPDVEFYVDDRRVIMESGECWYLDLSRPHRVHNCGAAERIHLVIDCRVNEWLVAQIAASVPVARPAGARSGQQDFGEFRERVLDDPSLQEELRAVRGASEFAAKAVDLGRARGFAFREEDVLAAMRRGRESWLSQWVL